MNVVSLKTTKPKTATTQSKRRTKALRRQAVSAVAVGSIATALTALSLTHLAHGIEAVTHCPSWEAYAMAVGIDLGFISAEMAQILAVTEKLAKKLSRFTKPTIIGTLVGSAAMNAFAFAAPADTYVAAAAGVVLGVGIPALIYALTRVGAALYIDCHAKA